ncbi:hypothetical protein M407DRAFT_23501 [Tulasnella calospora MUT 4182]|uniref:Uncharacterized protein n=1 Tax=Tulasnella calospora MUT 4182 TaxID=1051891 RepID=A0A0C3QL03_9AGAM|nr:hypothetical protein M407DRAFT_23501 [Tulasnella calospora MUT 4182]
MHPAHNVPNPSTPHNTNPTSTAGASVRNGDQANGNGKRTRETSPIVDEIMDDEDDVQATPKGSRAKRDFTSSFTPIYTLGTQAQELVEDRRIPQPNFGPTPKVPRTARTARERSGSAQPSGETTEPGEDPFVETLSPEEEYQKLINDFRNTKRTSDQEPDEGLVSFPRYSHPRSIHTSNFWDPYLRNGSAVATMATMKAKGAIFIWATAYKTSKITRSEEDLFKWGVLKLETLELVENLKLSEYSMPTVPRGAKAILVIAHSKEPAQRLLQNKVVTFRDGNTQLGTTKSGTFWLQLDDTWGSHIIFDIHGGGTDFERDVLPHLWATLGKVMLRPKGSVERPSEIELSDLHYHKVVWNDKTHKGTHATVWRVRFKPTSAVNAQGWALPRSIGRSNRGLIGIVKSPFCSHCISYSHAQGCCEWWKDSLTAGTKSKPQNYIEVEWKKIPSINPKKLAKA